MKLYHVKLILKGVSILGILLTIWAVFKLYQMGAFSDSKVLIDLLKGYGIWAPLIFILIQIIQVVIPILPGGVSLAAGVVMFGPWWGFLYNYIGIVLGSLALFWLGRRFGHRIIDVFVSEQTLQKYMHKLDSKGWHITFALLIFSPIAPDDTLVLLTSLTKMTWREYLDYCVR
nr:VTT domain-containing protein [Weissella cibaria]